MMLPTPAAQRLQMSVDISGTCAQAAGVLLHSGAGATFHLKDGCYQWTD